MTTHIDPTTAIVSIYIPTKNRSQSLFAAVASVQAQHHPHWEVVVVDDGSTDDTPERMRALVAEDPRFVYIRNETSRGACAARNRAISAARGDFMTGLDDDDEFAPDHLSAQLEYWHLLEKNNRTPSCVFVSYRYRNGERQWDGPKRGLARADDMFDANVVGNQIFAPRERFIAAGMFDEAMPAWQDLEFFYRFLKMFGPARLLDIPSYIFDITPRDDRISGQQKQKILNACALMYEKHGESDPKRLQRLLLQVHSEYYGFTTTWRDFLHFRRQGRFLRGHLTMFFRALGRTL